SARVRSYSAHAIVMGTSFDISSHPSVTTFQPPQTCELSGRRLCRAWTSIGLERVFSTTTAPRDDSSTIVESPERSQPLPYPIERRGRTAGPYVLPPRARQERRRVQAGLQRGAAKSRADLVCNRAVT